MLPSGAGNDMPDSHDVNGKGIGNRLERPSSIAFLANLFYFFFGKPRRSRVLAAFNLFRMAAHPVILSARSIISALGEAVAPIVAMCPQEKMRWIDAKLVVAAMKNIEVFWNFAVVKLPGKSMCSLTKPWSANGYPAVAMMGRSRPGPAIAVRPLPGSLVHLRPETLLNWNLRL